MKIDLIANDGSPIGVTPDLIYTRGVGGAELSMMSLMKTLAKRGHEIRVFNDPPHEARLFDGVEYTHRTTFRQEEHRDVLIIFRSPNRLLTTRSGAKRLLWWSCDQFTIGDYRILAAMVDYTICISAHHKEFFHAHYGIPKNKMGVIDLGVNISDYDEQEVERIPGKLIYCSIPDRGLNELRAAWPEIKKIAPHASLVITADYSLWGSSAMNSKFRLAWAGLPDVAYVGNIPRRDLIRHQLEADVHSYPCVYDELFCISAAECQVSGALPVTSTAGALRTTNELGITIPGDARTTQWQQAFAIRVGDLITTERKFLEKRREIMCFGARKRFDWEKIAERWEKVFEGESI